MIHEKVLFNQPGQNPGIFPGDRMPVSGFLCLSGILAIVLITLAGTACAGPVSGSFSYQGKLTDTAGQPLSGSYQMTFRIYDTSSGGTPLASDAKLVQCMDGLFNTVIDVTPAFFDGDQLWLGITVGSDSEMTPRQDLRAVPYALSLRPGSTINGSGTGVGALRIVSTDDEASGLIAVANGEDGTGIRSSSTGEGGTGISSMALGNDSRGVSAYTTGMNGYGVFASTTGPNSPAVYGISAQDTGIIGIGQIGAFFSTNQAGFREVLYPAVNVSTTYDRNPGIISKTRANNSIGVFSSTTGNNSSAIYGESENDVGIYGTGKGGAYFSTTRGGSPALDISTRYDQNPGIRVKTTGTASSGILVDSSGSSSTAITAKSYGGAAVSGTGYPGGYFKSMGSSDYARLGTNGIGIEVYGTHFGIKTDGWDYGLVSKSPVKAPRYVTSNKDVAEYMPVNGEWSPGTVMIIISDGSLQASSRPYDTRVAGIVSTSPGITLGGGVKNKSGEAPVAVSGRVPCKVDASSGPIHAGDLLTTSRTPGYAMKATRVETGTILGKAMGTLESGTGTIPVLVTLQ